MAETEKTPTTTSMEPPSTAAGGAFHQLARLRGEMDRLFDELVSGRRWPLSWGEELGRTALTAGNGLLEMKTDVSETEEAIEIVAEMPGVADKDVEVELVGDLLTIKGEKKQATEEKQKDFYRCERSFGAFKRSFSVPESVDRNAIKASVDKGVLHVLMPKKAEAKAKAKRIPVSSK